MNKTIVIYNEASRFSNILKKMDLVTLKIYDNSIDLSYLDDKSFDHLIDLTNFNYKKKIELFEIFKKYHFSNIITDLSFNNPQIFNLKKYNIDSVVSFNCWSPNEVYEVYEISQKVQGSNKPDSTSTETSPLIKIVELLKIKIKRLKSKELMFIYPKIIATIINEAFYSLDDQLATESDIDLAMKYGLNYPIGPFEWSQRIGCQNIAQLLDEYFDYSKKQRYACSISLRQRAYNE